MINGGWQTLRSLSWNTAQINISTVNMANLGVMYAKGQGGTRNYVCAYMWFSLAAARGNSVAAKEVAIAEKRMSPADMSRAQSLTAAWTPRGKACP